MKVIQLSDTHVQRISHHLYGRSPSASLAHAVRHIREHHADADLAVVSGDLVNAGHPEEYAEIARVLSALPMPLRLLPGNHDERKALGEAFPAQPRMDGGFIQSEVEGDGVRVLLLDTLVDRKPYGRLCEPRLAWLEERLAASEVPAYLFMHHPPIATGHVDLDGMRLKNGDEMVALLQRHRDRVRHVFFGHVHRPFFAVLDGIGYSCVPGTHHQLSLKGMATGEAWACYEPAGYVIARLEPDGPRVHYQLMTPDETVFPF